MQLRSLTPKTRIQFSSHTFFKFLFPKKFWRRPGTPGTSNSLARLLQESTSNYGRGQSRTVPAQKWTCPPSIPLVISPQYTVTERSLKNESDVRNKMCKVVPGPMQVIVWGKWNFSWRSEKSWASECMIIIIKHEPYWTSTYNFFKNRGEQIESRGLCLSRSWHKITLVLTAPGAFWIVFPGFQPSYPRYDEPSSLLRQSGCVDICSKRFNLFCTFRRHVTLHLQHGSWLRGVQS